MWDLFSGIFEWCLTNGNIFRIQVLILSESSKIMIMSKINNKFMKSHLPAGKTFSNFFCKPYDQKKILQIYCLKIILCFLWPNNSTSNNFSLKWSHRHTQNIWVRMFITMLLIIQRIVVNLGVLMSYGLTVQFNLKQTLDYCRIFGVREKCSLYMLSEKNSMDKNSAVATGLEKVSFHSNPKERQCQRMLRLLHNCTHLTH